MLSPSAQDGFDLLLMQALKGSLIPSDEQAEVAASSLPMNSPACVTARWWY